MQSKRKARVAALADLKLLIAPGTSPAPQKADVPRKPSHKNRGNHGGQPSSAVAPRAPRLDAPVIKPKAMPDAQPVTILAAPVSQTPIDHKDAALFRRAMANVARIHAPQRTGLPAASTEAPDVLRQRRAHAAGKDTVPRAALSDSFAPASPDQDDSQFLRPGHGPDVIANLRLGKWPIQASLDLHGATVDDARERLDRFLHSCITHRLRSVLIVHGKGYGSQDGEPVLKAAVRRWLTQMADVIAYTESAAPHGGSGAVQILLKAT